MTIIHQSKIVSYTCEQMYHLVDDVKSYSQFVSGCTKSEEINRTISEVEGKLTFSTAGIEQSFTTLNLLKPHKKISLLLVQGPFKYLRGYWKFSPLNENKSQISLDLEFQLSNLILENIFGPFFEKTAENLIQSFTNRAKEIYEY